MPMFLRDWWRSCYWPPAQRVIFACFISAVIAGSVRLDAFGQLQYAAIKGIITDPSGRIVSEAQLIIRQTQNGAQRETSTDQTGGYQLEGLGAGEYELQITALGFGTGMYGLTLKAGDYLTVNIQLELPQLTQSVSVL